jgi:predicted small metal-binding protein
MAEQKKAEEFGITEDDVSEIRQDINKFMWETLTLVGITEDDVSEIRQDINKFRWAQH